MMKFMLLFLFTFLADVTPAPSEALPSYEGAFLKMFLTLLALIVGVIGTVWFLKRLSGARFGGSSGQSLKVLEKKALSPKTMLYRIEVEGKQVVIAESQLEVKSLMTLEATSEEAPS